LLARASKQVVGQYYGSDRRETDEAKAERLVQAELGRRGWMGKNLVRRRKGDGGMGAIARKLRAETTMSLKWIAKRLAMGTWTNVSNLLMAGTKTVRSEG